MATVKSTKTKKRKIKSKGTVSISEKSKITNYFKYKKLPCLFKSGFKDVSFNKTIVLKQYGSLPEISETEKTA